MHKIPATVFILTKDSSETIRRALESASVFEEILVCDGNSTDGTLDIVRTFGARIVPQDRACLAEGRIKDFACTRNAGIAHARFDWVLYIDSDETVSPALAREVGEFLTGKPNPAVCRIPAGIVLDGKPIRYSSNYPGYQIRFFNRTVGSFKKPIHERFVPQLGTPYRTFRSPWHYYLESGTIREEYEKDLARDLPLFKVRYAGRSWKVRFYGVYRSLRSAAGVFLRGGWNALVHRGQGTYPFRLEWLRVKYHWEVLLTILHV